MKILNFISNSEILFADIENIHKVRKAYSSLFNFWSKYDHIKDKRNILSKIESWGWMILIKNILSTSSDIASRVVLKNQSVLVHWSDGWDRTSQLWSLSQMLIDPYYRTLVGFEVIIEKEWTGFGHKFEARWGHFQDQDHEENERSPIFIQFLDCVHQLLKQFPTSFQFNNKLLLFLAHHVYTCKFGTFLFDNERTRIKIERINK